MREKIPPNCTKKTTRRNSQHNEKSINPYSEKSVPYNSWYANRYWSRIVDPYKVGNIIQLLLINQFERCHLFPQIDRSFTMTLSECETESRITYKLKFNCFVIERYKALTSLDVYRLGWFTKQESINQVSRVIEIKEGRRWMLAYELCEYA